MGGTITGLAAGGLVLATTGQPDLPIVAGQTTFTFAYEVPAGTVYHVIVKAQPDHHTCTVEAGDGAVSADVTDVAVRCVAATWIAAGQLSKARGFFGAVRLPSGAVLAVGGQPSFTGDWATAVVDVRAPATGAWSLAKPLSVARNWTLPCVLALQDGRVFAGGGANPQAEYGMATAELYDATLDAWSPTAGPMAGTHEGGVCVLLANGKVLVAGGVRSTGSTTDAELFDPATGLFSPTGAMRVARYWGTATLLASGKVLVAGGCLGGWPCTVSTTSAEVYDPGTGTWSDVAPLPYSVMTHTATLLPSGKVLVAAGCQRYSGTGKCGNAAEDRRAALYDPSAGALGTWTATGSLGWGHADHVALLLADGDVLVVGGGLWSGSASGTERYDVSAGTWTPGPPTIVNHGNGLRAVKLADGRWMVIGGADPYNGTAEILDEGG
ncbi:MAG: hypothetical protein U0229_12535 [Anaeromyxobacter sp.]